MFLLSPFFDNSLSSVISIFSLHDTLNKLEKGHNVEAL